MSKKSQNINYVSPADAEEKRLAVLDKVMDKIESREISLPPELPKTYYPTVEEIKHSIKGKENEFYPLFLFFASNPYKGIVNTKEYANLVEYSFQKANEIYDEVINSIATKW